MFSWIKSFFTVFWKALTWSRIAILNILFLIIVIVFIQAVASGPKIEIPNKSALVISPSGVLVDQSSYNPSLLDALDLGGDQPNESVVRDIVKAIHYARDDALITGIILQLDYLEGGGISKIEEIGQALNDFKESNKPIIAYADSYSQQSYLLASYADSIYVNTLGDVHITGFGVYRNYVKNAAEKLSLKFHVFRVGEYKDAVEPFLRDSMSEPSREHVSAWLNALWQRYTSSVAERRDLPGDSIDTYIRRLYTPKDDLRGDSAQLALKLGLIDGIQSRNTMKGLLIDTFGHTKDTEEINTIDMSAYLANPLLKRSPTQKDQIGLLVASGNIMDGHQPEGSIGSDTLAQLIKQARENTSLRALIVRVDSGGGSAFASEVIREELQAAKEGGLPIYISMGSVAASGGYWMAMPAQEIWATPTTITGSIGVFGLIPNLEESLKRVGITSDGVGTSPLADAYHFERAMSPETKAVIQSSVENIYQRFISLVADARNSTPEAVHDIAQGRVWYGEKALELGLVDKLGSLEDVIRDVAAQQGLEKYSVTPITRELSPREQFLRTLMEQAKTGDKHFSSDTAKQITGLSKLMKRLGLDETIPYLQKTKAPAMQVYATCTYCVAP